MEIRPTESEEFVSRVNGKEPVAWEELYARYYKALCAYSASAHGDAAFAEDLVQELLLRMWQSDRTFSVLPELAAYLYRSVYINRWPYRRDRSNRESLLRNMHEQQVRDEVSPPHFDPEADTGLLAGMVGEEVIRRLYSDIHALPSEQSRIIRLSIAGVQGRRDRPPAGHQHQHRQNPEVPRLPFAAAQTQQIFLPLRFPLRPADGAEIKKPLFPERE